MERYNKKNHKYSEFDKNGLTFSRFIDKVKTTCIRLNQNFTKLEEILEVEIRQGKISKAELSAFVSMNSNPKATRLYAEIDDILYYYRVRLIDTFFDRGGSGYSIYPWINGNIKENIIKLTYLMGIRGIHTEADKELLCPVLK